MALAKLKVTITDPQFFQDAQNRRESIRVWNVPKYMPHWIENWDSQNQQGKVWIKVPKIPANGSVDVWLYYGNPNATDKSDGDAVFEFFDDFSTDTKWTITDTNYIWINTTEKRMYYKSGTSAYAYVQLPQTYDKFRLVVKGVRTRSDAYGVADVELEDTPKAWEQENNAIAMQIDYSSDYTYLRWVVSGTSSSSTTGAASEQLNTAYTRVLTYDGSVATLRVLELSSNIQSNVGAISGLSYLVLSLRNYAGQEGYITLVYLTKYANQEPTVTIGAEEASDINGWAYRRKITISNPNSYDLTDFQVAISLDNTTFDFTKANSDGSDVRVALDPAYTEALSYYIDTWDTTTPQAVIYVAIDDADPDFYIEVNPAYTTDASDSSVLNLADDTTHTTLKSVTRYSW